jgi:hypothetical protein
MDESSHQMRFVPAEMPFIVLLPDSGKADQSTRKLIRSHVMRGRNPKRAKRRSVVGRASSHPIQRIKVTLHEVVTMYTSLQPQGVGTHLYFVDFPSEIEPSILMGMAQGLSRSLGRV